MTDTHQTYNELDPLLPRADGQGSPAGSVLDDGPAAQVPEEEDGRTLRQRLRIAIPCLVAFLCLDFGAVLINAGMNEVTEAIICRNLLGDIVEADADSRCKDTVVQTEFALIMGWEMTFSCVPGLLVGIPFGLAADKYGRRAILLLVLLGFALSQAATVIVCRFPDIFAIRLRWAASAFLLIGGGPSTFNSLIFTIATDITTQVQRSTAFFFLGTTILVGGLLANPLASMIMSLGSAWLAIYIGTGLMVLTIPITAALPESRCKAVVRRAELARKAMSNSRPEASRWGLRPAFATVREQISLIVRVLFVQKPAVGILIVSTMFSALGRSVAMLLLQYVTKTFGWSWAKAPLIETIRGAAGLFVMAVLLPLVSQILLKTNMVSLVKDWWLVRVSAVIMALGSLGMGMAPTVPLFIAAMVFGQLGTGQSMALRSMLTEMIDQTHVAMLMSVVSAFTTVSELFAGPFLAQMFHVGMVWGGKWVGLPFITSAGTLAVGAAMVIFVPVRQSARPKGTPAWMADQDAVYYADNEDGLSRRTSDNSVY